MLLHVSVYHRAMPEEISGSRDWNADTVRGLRSRMGLTQQQLARRLGVRQQTVSEWETGLYTPRGASVTLLHMVSEEAGATYRTGAPEDRKDEET